MVKIKTYQIRKFYQELNDPHQIFHQYVKRQLFIVVILLFFFIILLSRLFFLQIIKSNRYLTLSNKNQLALLPIEPKRGIIYDRNGIPLATNKAIFNLEIIPQLVKNLSNTLEEINKIIPLKENYIEEVYKTKSQQRSFEPITLKEKLTQEEMALIAVHLHELVGVKISAKLIRQYPYNEIMAHLIGYTGLITQSELQKLEAESGTKYLSNQPIGKLGIEKYYDELLQGQIGYEQVEVDARGRIVRTNHVIEPKSGSDLYLTIDAELQKKVHKIMEGYRGAAVLLNPKTGEVLALVSQPSFDPNQFTHGLDHSSFQNLLQHPHRPLFNRAINGQYPMASTIKPFIALLGLETNTITPKYEIYDPGWYKLPNNDHIYKDMKWRTGGHGWVNLETALTVSCDTYFYHLAHLLGINQIKSILKKFGLGKKTEIDLHNESAGLVPDPQWKKKTKKQGWYLGDTILIGIGQGFMSTTPIQLAQATMLMALQGYGYKPHLLDKYISSDGSSISTPLTPLPTVNLKNEKVWTLVHHGMRSVVTKPYGTGRRFGSDTKYSVAGKTGTGQVFSAKFHQYLDLEHLPEHLRDNSSFIAFAPIESPEVVLSIVIENSPGASVLARKILDAYFSNHRVYA